MSLDDVEGDLDTIYRSDARRDNRVFPIHGVAFQPAVCDGSGDHGMRAGASAGLHDIDPRGEGVFRAMQVVISDDVPAGRSWLVHENLSGERAITDISSNMSPNDYAGHVRQNSRPWVESGHPFGEVDRGGAVVVSARDWSLEQQRGREGRECECVDGLHSSVFLFCLFLLATAKAGVKTEFQFRHAVLSL